ncbi:hypothetical protein FACS1894133_5460 [Clostridia bacterium]|nr:hypothetical protein FACS1894133_5460 [Clostridia bacterium]
MAFFGYKNIGAMFKSSASELKSTRCLATTGVLCALHIAIETLTKIELPGGISINFAFIGLFSIAMLYGPVVAMLAAVPCDIFPVILRGRELIPVFTLIAISTGLIYGLIAYGVRFGKYGGDSGGGSFSFAVFRARFNSYRGEYLRVILAHVAVVIIVFACFNTIAAYIYGFAKVTFWTYFWVRVGKQIVELPFDLLLLFVVCPVVSRVYERIQPRRA